MTLKNILRTLVLLPLSVYLVYCAFHFITTEIHPTFLDCGKVVSKSNDEVAVKHGTRTELYLIVQFNKSGVRAIECNPTTYFSKKVGDNVCFKQPKEVSEWYTINHVVGVVTLIVLGAIVLWNSALYLFPDSWKEERW